MSEVAFLTRVRKKEADPLRKFLRNLRKRPGGSPFANMGTHFARFVVIDIGKPHLLFTSRFDGDEVTYLSSLAGKAEAQDIWGHCVQPGARDERALREYLLNPDAQVHAVYAIPRWSDVTVAEVNDAMASQSELVRFALQAEGLSALELAHSFRLLPSVRRVIEQ
jgi:hypothetical protein